MIAEVIFHEMVSSGLQIQPEMIYCILINFGAA